MSSNLNIVSLRENVTEELSLGKDDKFFSIIYVQSPAIIENSSGFISCKPGSFLVRSSGSSTEITPSEEQQLSVNIVSLSGSDITKLVRISGIQTDIVYSPMHCHFADSILGKFALNTNPAHPNGKHLLLHTSLSYFLRSFVYLIMTY